jgi:hypothetical protein
MKASYSFRSWDLNGVPIAMIFATHFYFSLYFTFSNMTLHKVLYTLRSHFAFLGIVGFQTRFSKTTLHLLFLPCVWNAASKFQLLSLSNVHACFAPEQSTGYLQTCFFSRMHGSSMTVQAKIEHF